MSDFLFGVNVPSAAEQAGSSKFSLTVSVANPKDVKAQEEALKKFDEYYKKLYKDLVGTCHKYLLRVTPLHTGKLRGGWTAFLDKYQIDYSKQLYDTSLYSVWKKANKTEEYRSYAPDSSKVAEGKTFSHLEDNLPKDTVVSLENQVEYKDAMDFGTATVPGRHFTDIALYKAEHWFDKYFSLWLAKMEKAGAVVPPPAVEEIPN
jgi:hypothetical protein